MQMPPTSTDQASLSFGAAFGIALAITMAIAFAMVRAWAGDADQWATGAFLAAVLVPMSAYFAGPRLLPAMAVEQARLAAFLLALVGSSLLALLVQPAMVFVAALLLLTVILLFFGARGSAPSLAAIGAVVGIVFGAWLFVRVNSMGHATVLVPERAVEGSLNMDTLYHSAIISMLQHFGVPSVGLDGIVLQRYHTLTHMMLSALGRAAGTGGVPSLALGNQLVLLPLAFFGLVVAATPPQTTNRVLGTLSSLIALSAITLFGLFDWDSYLLSETHAFGLSFVLLSLPFIRSLSMGDRRLRWSTLIVCVALAGLAMGAKVACGAAVIATIGYLLIRTKRLSLLQWIFAAASAVVGLVLLVLIFLPASNAAEGKFQILSFYRAFPYIGFVNTLPVALSMLCCVLSWLRGNARAWNEALFILLFVCLLPTMLMNIGGGSAYYFINIGAFVGIADLSVRLTSALAGRLDWRFGVVAGALLLGLLGTDLVSRKVVDGFTESLTTLVAQLPAGDASATPKQRAQLLPLARLAASIEGASQSGARELVFLAAAARAASPYTCSATPLFIPSYLGEAQLFGMPPKSLDCPLGPHYGYSENPNGYAPEVTPDDTSLCAAVEERGFDRLIIAETPDAVRAIQCRPAS